MKAVKRSVAPAILFLLALVVWFLVLRPLEIWKDGQVRLLEEAGDEKARLLNAISGLETEKAILSGEGDVRFLWTSPQIGTATAEVQAAISEIAAESGISLRSITPLPSSEGNAGSTIAFRIETEVAIDTLTSFLAAMEYSQRALVIRSATLRRLARPDGETPMPVLFVQMDVVAPIVLTGGNP